MYERAALVANTVGEDSGYLGWVGGGMWAAALAAGRWSLGWYGGVLPGVNGFDFLTL